MRKAFLTGALHQFLDDGEAVEARHLDVEKDQVGMVLLNERDSFNAVGPFADDLDISDRSEQVL